MARADRAKPTVATHSTTQTAGRGCGGCCISRHKSWKRGGSRRPGWSANFQNKLPEALGMKAADAIPTGSQGTQVKHRTHVFSRIVRFPLTPPAKEESAGEKGRALYLIFGFNKERKETGFERVGGHCRFRSKGRETVAL